MAIFRVEKKTDFIEDKGLNFHRGNAVKYIARAGKKNPGIAKERGVEVEE